MSLEHTLAVISMGYLGTSFVATVLALIYGRAISKQRGRKW